MHERLTEFTLSANIEQNGFWVPVIGNDFSPTINRTWPANRQHDYPPRTVYLYPGFGGQVSSSGRKSNEASRRHQPCGSLPFAEDDPPLGQVVRGKFNADLIARDNANKILAHSSGDMGQDLVSVLQLDSETGIC